MFSQVTNPSELKSIQGNNNFQFEPVTDSNELKKVSKISPINTGMFDPANQTPQGTYVPQGEYEEQNARNAESILPNLFMPGISVGENLISRLAINPALNALSRIGVGTASNVAAQSPQINNMQDLSDITNQSLKLNSLLEAGGGLLR